MVLKFKATSNAPIPMDPQEKFVMLIDKPSRNYGDVMGHRVIQKNPWEHRSAKLHIKCCQSDHQKRSSGSCQESQTWHRCAVAPFLSQISSSRFRFLKWRLNLSLKNQLYHIYIYTYIDRLVLLYIIEIIYIYIYPTIIISGSYPFTSTNGRRCPMNGTAAAWRHLQRCGFHSIPKMGWWKPFVGSRCFTKNPSKIGYYIP